MADSDQNPASSRAGATRAKAKPTIRRGIQRQSKAERDEYNRKEAEKAKERAAQDVTAGTKTTRGGTAARARGGSLRNNARSATNDAFTLSGGSHTAKKATQETGSVEELDGAGPSAAQDTKQAAAPSTNVTEMLDTSEPATSGKRAGRAAAKKDPDAYAQIEYEQDDPSRRDIEHIWISSGEDDENEDPIKRHKGKRRQESRTTRSLGGLRPVRAPRIRREEEQEEKANKAAGVRTTKISRANDSTAIIDVDADDVQINEIAVKKDPPSSPELSKKPLRRSSSKPKDPKILSETIEDRAERLRLAEDVRKLKGEFLHRDLYENMDVDGDEGSPTRMFLFQLPPLIPQLQDPLNPPPELVQAALNDIAAGPSADGTVKAEPGTGVAHTEAQKQAVEKAKRTEEERKKFTANKVDAERLTTGFVGKLNVHRSGKISLDWGGTDMEVRWGSEVDFLQDAVLVEEDQGGSGEMDVDGEEGKKEKRGKAFALGQVRKKMVVIPDWSKLYT